MPGLGCKPRSARLRASSPARVGSNPRLHRHNLIKLHLVTWVAVVIHDPQPTHIAIGMALHAPSGSCRIPSSTTCPSLCASRNHCSKWSA